MKNLLFFLLFLSVPNVVLSQLYGDFIDESQHIFLPFTISNYGTRHGLPQNQIVSISAKKDGELVLSTANGIVSFDGQSFNPFIKNNAYLRGIYSKTFFDDKNEILYGIENGQFLNEIHPKFKTICKANTGELIHRTIHFITPEGTIKWYDLDKKTYSEAFQTGIKNCFTLYYHQGNYYLSNYDGLFIYYPKLKKFKQLTRDYFVKIKWNKYDGAIYGITKQSLVQINGTQLKPIELEGISSSTDFKDLTFTKELEFFIASTDGLYYKHPMYSEVFEESDYFPTHHFESLYFSERENCVFLGSTNKGLFKLMIKNCGSFDIEGPMSQVALCSVTSNSENDVFFSGTDNKIYTFGLDGSKEYLNLSPLAISSLSIIDDYFYIGTWGQGVQIRDANKKLIKTILNPEIKKNDAFSCYKDKQGKIWIGHSNGISCQVKQFTFKPFLPSIIVGKTNCFFDRKNGDLCIGGSNGLYILDKNRKLKQHFSAKQIKCKEIRSFHEDKEGKLWIGTYNGGLYCLENYTLTSINSLPNCKLPNEVFTLAYNEGNLIISSNLGLWVINEKKLNDFYRRKIDFLIPFVYGNEAGIFNSEFNGGFQNNYLKSGHGHFYFPSIQGIVTYTPELIDFYKIKPKLVKVLRNNIEIDKIHQFNPQTNSLSFYFHTPNFINKFNVHFQYALVGSDHKIVWSELSKSGHIRFDFLPHGNYTLKVRVLDAFNDSHPYSYNYSFSIAPYWYQTWWFHTVLIVILFTLILIGIRIRLNVIRQKEIRNNKINNTLLELKLKAIQSNMNPHFMFNTLNNIQYLIIQNKAEEAEIALNQFSLLLRKFLEQSDFSFVTLKEEIELIKLYLNIENYRFNHELNIQIDIDSACENAIIPTLLLQPIVENAIKHGLAHSQTDKRLYISVVPMEHSIKIAIEDNGIGRKAAENINAFRSNHVSKGQELVSQKIKIINDKYHLNIIKEVTDLTSPAMGTRVVFIIPKIDNELLNS